jgi:hypothetical protein
VLGLRHLSLAGLVQELIDMLDPERDFRRYVVLTLRLEAELS